MNVGCVPSPVDGILHAALKHGHITRFDKPGTLEDEEEGVGHALP